MWSYSEDGKRRPTYLYVGDESGSLFAHVKSGETFSGPTFDGLVIARPLAPLSTFARAKLSPETDTASGPENQLQTGARQQKAETL